MTSSRRSFLRTLGLALAAPAVVKAENIMKIWVPPEPKIELGRGMSESYFHVDESPFMAHMDDFTMETWVKVPKEHQGKWQHLSIVRKNKDTKYFIDAKQVRGDHSIVKHFVKESPNVAEKPLLVGDVKIATSQSFSLKTSFNYTNVRG